MLHLNNRLLTTFAAFVSAASALLGQAGNPAPKPPSQDDTGTVFRAGYAIGGSATTRLMDKNGHLVTTLPPRRLSRCWKTGVQQKSSNSSGEGRPGLHGTGVIDNSGSMRDKRAKVEARRPGAGQRPPTRRLRSSSSTSTTKPSSTIRTARISPATSRRWKTRSRRHRFARRHGHAGCHPHVHRPREGKGAQGTRKSWWWSPTATTIRASSAWRTW